MPIKIERKLKATAREKFPKDKERQDKYVYGTLAKLKKQGAKGFGDRDNWIPVEDTGIRFGILAKLDAGLGTFVGRGSAVSFSDFRQKRKAAQKKYAKKISGWVSKKTYGQYRPHF